MKKLLILALSAGLALGLAACQRQEDKGQQQPPVADQNAAEAQTAPSTVPSAPAPNGATTTPSIPVAPSDNSAAGRSDERSNNPPVATPSTPATPDNQTQSIGNT